MYGSTTNKLDVESGSADAVPKTNGKRMNAATFAISLVSVSAILAFAFSSTNSYYSRGLNFKIAKSTGNTDYADISFTLYRADYEPLGFFTGNSTVQYEHLKNYTAIIEPFADMDLYVMNSDSIRNYKFTACLNAGKGDTCYHGIKTAEGHSDQDSYINVPCSPYDEFTVTVTEYSESWLSLGSSTATALCMYVRREIRSLTASDLSDTMDAMATLWKMSEEEGQELYGTDFHNSTYFASAHDFNAAWQDADHIHEGLGFLPQHLKITNYFEMAMQAVNPAVTLPYWDFTMDTAQNLTIFESFVFTNETFGSLVKPVDHYWGWTYKSDDIQDAKIPDGRWEGIGADYNYKYPELQNAFGYIRGPWNMNPSPFVSRFAGYSLDLPSCLDYFAWGSDNDFIDFMIVAAYGPHASTHGAIGSVYGCDLLDPLLDQHLIKDAESQRSICKKWGFYMKELYRANYIKSIGECSMTSLTYNGVHCGFECNQESYESLANEIKDLINSDYLPQDLSTRDYETWRDFICEGDGYRIFVGDHLESASPSDPSFWPIHPTMERLVHAKLSTGAFEKFSWPTDAKNDYVCDKSMCYDADEQSRGYYESCCYGHFEFDQLLDFVNGDKNNGMGPTNHQMMSDINPSSEDYGVNYVYDSFKWDHCNEDFETLFENSNSDKAKSQSKMTESKVSENGKSSEVSGSSSSSVNGSNGTNKKSSNDDNKSDNSNDNNSKSSSKSTSNSGSSSSSSSSSSGSSSKDSRSH